MKKYIKFNARMRLRKVGGYLNIPQEIMEKLKAKIGDVVEIKFSNCPTKTGTYIHSTTIQIPASIYLRKLDLTAIGLPNDHQTVTNIEVSMRVIIEGLPTIDGDLEVAGSTSDTVVIDPDEPWFSTTLI